jgi:hypothetical protein
MEGRFMAVHPKLGVGLFHQKPFPFCSFLQANISGEKGVAVWVIATGNQRCCELKGICSPKCMNV